MLVRIILLGKMYQGDSYVFFSPRSDGSAAAIVCSENFVKKHGLEAQAIEILALEMATDFRSTFEEKSNIKLVGYDMSKAAAARCYEKTGQSETVLLLHD